MIGDHYGMVFYGRVWCFAQSTVILVAALAIFTVNTLPDLTFKIIYVILSGCGALIGAGSSERDSGLAGKRAVCMQK